MKPLVGRLTLTHLTALVHPEKKVRMRDEFRPSQSFFPLKVVLVNVQTNTISLGRRVVREIDSETVHGSVDREQFQREPDDGGLPTTRLLRIHAGNSQVIRVDFDSPFCELFRAHTPPAEIPPSCARCVTGGWRLTSRARPSLSICAFSGVIPVDVHHCRILEYLPKGPINTVLGPRHI